MTLNFSTTKSSIMALVLCTGLLAGCAGSAVDAVQTSSLDPNAAKMAAAAAAKPDPTCVALLAKIDGMRKDGVAERAEQAAQGKSTTVPVKRASLGQLAELSKANTEYQSKCSCQDRIAGQTCDGFRGCINSRGAEC